MRILIYERCFSSDRGKGLEAVIELECPSAEDLQNDILGLYCSSEYRWVVTALNVTW